MAKVVKAMALEGVDEADVTLATNEVLQSWGH